MFPEQVPGSFFRWLCAAECVLRLRDDGAGHAFADGVWGIRGPTQRPRPCLEDALQRAVGGGVTQLVRWGRLHSTKREYGQLL